jgi:hypothetical protein
MLCGVSSLCLGGVLSPPDKEAGGVTLIRLGDQVPGCEKTISGSDSFVRSYGEKIVQANGSSIQMSSCRICLKEVNREVEVRIVQHEGDKVSTEVAPAFRTSQY